MSHTFKTKTFHKPTNCEACDGLLWGVRRQGRQCQGCGYTCHDDCTIAAPPKCSFININNNNNNNNYGPSSPGTKNVPGTLLSQTNTTATTSEHIQNVIVTAAIHAADSTDPPNEYLANLPPLNAQISAKNFVRFASRCGFMFSFRDSVLLLLSWEKPLDTCVAMAIYCMICFHPKLLLLAPQVILLNIIISAYSKRHERQQREAEQAATAGAGGRTAAMRAAVAENSPEYLRNMQNLQNMMGEVSDGYDAVVNNMHFVDWSSEATTWFILQMVILSSIGLIFVIWFVPLHLLALQAGITVFMSNTRFAKYCMREFSPYLINYAKARLQIATEWYTEFEKQVDEQERVREVSLYENQRWWSESGFAPQLLDNERNAWSDLSGSVQLPPKEDMAAPKGYRWTQDNWKLDTAGPWIDDTLGIEFLVSPEEGGWVYTDNNWEYSGKKQERPARLTRRRRWIRQCERIPNNAVPSSSSIKK
ncbi:integral peroxisomal membrane peroxin-domain-containing protein [Phascolomyces articulosus]|uniref:Integral peroxisomal membrane peroxin-domain-containing protein n=1 Tax=Phascolomyces articulosus TaxID=60185 RepID=A0AAD5JWS8_9FUNG|nr:integral peroxisomal membrane peroxin-domain-containing protein [Phascolomyces articulosus]